MERRIAVWIMTPRTLTCEDLLAERLFSSQLIQRLRRRQCRAASDCYQPRRCDQQDDTQKMFLRVRQGYCNDSSATLAYFAASLQPQLLSRSRPSPYVLCLLPASDHCRESRTPECAHFSRLDSHSMHALQTKCQFWRVPFLLVLNVRS